MAKLFIDTISISGSRIGRPSRSSKFQLTRCELTTTTMTTPTTTIRTPGNSERLEYSRGQNSNQSVFSNSVRLQHRKGREVLFMGFEDCFYFFFRSFIHEATTSFCPWLCFSRRGGRTGEENGFLPRAQNFIEVSACIFHCVDVDSVCLRVLVSLSIGGTFCYFCLFIYRFTYVSQLTSLSIYCTSKSV